MMLSHSRMGSLLRSLAALRHFPQYSLVKSSLSVGFVQRQTISAPTQFASVAPYRSLHNKDAVKMMMDNITITFKTKSSLTDSEWEDVIDNFIKCGIPYRKSHPPNFDPKIMSMCCTYLNFALANSYLEYLEKKNIELSSMALGNYLHLCGLTVEECGEEKVFNVYQDLLSRYKILDVTLSENAILALTKTSQWKQAFKHLPVIEKLCSVKPIVYSALIVAAFKNGEYDTGWQILETMHREGKRANDEVFLEWINQCELAKDKESMMNVLLHLFQKDDVYPSVTVIEEIRKFYRKHFGWFGKYALISYSGRCPACNQQLKDTVIDEEAFAQLKEEFIDRVLVKSDILLRTTPEELESFSSFVKEEGPFSFVIDSLNIAFTFSSQSRIIRMKKILDVVAFLHEQNRSSRVLVIGRKHMEAWSPDYMELIKERASVYLLENKTEEDSFFIYAALRSGMHARLVTRDLLRDHLYSLGDPLLRKTFKHWQILCQMVYKTIGQDVYILPPPKFVSAPQKGDGAWHVPYNGGFVDGNDYKVPHTFLCLQAKPHQFGESSFMKNVSESPIEEGAMCQMPKPNCTKVLPGVEDIYYGKYKINQTNDAVPNRVIAKTNFHRITMPFKKKYGLPPLIHSSRKPKIYKRRPLNSNSGMLSQTPPFKQNPKKHMSKKEKY